MLSVFSNSWRLCRLEGPALDKFGLLRGPFSVVVKSKEPTVPGFRSWLLITFLFCDPGQFLFFPTLRCFSLIVPFIF